MVSQDIDNLCDMIHKLASENNGLNRSLCDIIEETMRTHASRVRLMEMMPLSPALHIEYEGNVVPLFGARPCVR